MTTPGPLDETERRLEARDSSDAAARAMAAPAAACGLVGGACAGQRAHFALVLGLFPQVLPCRMGGLDAADGVAELREVIGVDCVQRDPDVVVLAFVRQDLLDRLQRHHATRDGDDDAEDEGEGVGEESEEEAEPGGGGGAVEAVHRHHDGGMEHCGGEQLVVHDEHRGPDTQRGDRGQEPQQARQRRRRQLAPNGGGAVHEPQHQMHREPDRLGAFRLRGAPDDGDEHVHERAQPGRRRHQHPRPRRAQVERVQRVLLLGQVVPHDPAVLPAPRRVAALRPARVVVGPFDREARRRQQRRLLVLVHDDREAVHWRVCFEQDRVPGHGPEVGGRVGEARVDCDCEAEDHLPERRRLLEVDEAVQRLVAHRVEGDCVDAERHVDDEEHREQHEEDHGSSQRRCRDQWR
mmetsp:Transcript_16327/g.38896  ORF Transcript_16327/g.38896 Transcript_16327/m.38896 type:complete len:407 (+) Transcript_16327:625-1845(+)